MRVRGAADAFGTNSFWGGARGRRAGGLARAVLDGRGKGGRGLSQGRREQGFGGSGSGEVWARGKQFGALGGEGTEGLGFGSGHALLVPKKGLGEGGGGDIKNKIKLREGEKVHKRLLL
ncbi:unnamed protein product [Calypogeia fissa]